MKKWMVLVLVAALLVLVACGGGEDVDAAAPAAEAPTAQEAIEATLQVAMGDLFYGEAPNNMETPPVWTVGAGDVVALEMVNAGALEHNWAIVKPGTEIPVPFMPDTNGDLLLYEAGLVKPGEEAQHVFTAPAAGEYNVICTVAGHYPSMQGRLVVN